VSLSRLLLLLLLLRRGLMDANYTTITGTVHLACRSQLHLPLLQQDPADAWHTAIIGIVHLESPSRALPLPLLRRNPTVNTRLRVVSRTGTTGTAHLVSQSQRVLHLPVEAVHQPNVKPTVIIGTVPPESRSRQLLHQLVEAVHLASAKLMAIIGTARQVFQSQLLLRLRSLTAVHPLSAATLQRNWLFWHVLPSDGACSCNNRQLEGLSLR
jgi:hypothetical protein